MSKISVLVLTNDVTMVKNLQERTKSFLAEFSFVPLSNGEKLAEYAVRYVPDILLIDDAFVDPLNTALVEKIYSTLSSGAASKRPLFLLSAERKAGELRKILKNGFLDVFTKPVDPSMFFQKLQVYLPQNQFLKDRLLFSMNVDSRLELASECKLVGASEYGVTIRLNRELQVGETYTIHAEMFGETEGECLARVVACIAALGAVEKFEASLLFIAPRKEALSAIRLWMKHEYIRIREAKI